MDYRAFWLPKDGNTPEQYEDASGGDRQTGRFAVADGASESVFAADWARLLVDQFLAVVEIEPGGAAAWLGHVWELWPALLRGRNLPWYAQEKLRIEGANATFLGIWLDDCSQGPCQWHALSVGDTCLFHTRNNELLAAFPLTHSEQFSSGPPLVCSRLSPAVIEERRMKWAEGQMLPHDRLWLMTDALAACCLSQHEAGDDPWNAMEWLLGPATSDADFADWIQELRATGQLRNDDATLLVVSL